jgi:hypothetical protein
MIKKTSLFLMASLLVGVLLGACGSVQASTAAGSGTTAAAPQGSQAPGGGSGSLPESEKLLIGTLKLEGTPQAVTAQQAAALLPLWKAVKSMDGGSSTSPVELQALYDQIKGTMTSDQMNAIDAMNLTFTSVRDEMSALGIQFGGRTNGSSGQNGSQSGGTTRQNGGTTRQGGNNGGQFRPPDGGGFGGGGFGGNGGGTVSPQQQATFTAARAARANAVPSALVDALITVLQKRAGQ